MAVAFFGQTSDPTPDNDATGNPGPTVTFTPPASMVTNDLVLVFLGYKSTSTTLTFVETVSGGQTWTLGTYNYGGATSSLMSQYRWCRFDGTWDADPIFTMSNAGTSPMSGLMLVYRGVDTTTAIDAAEARTANAAPGGSFDMSNAGVTTATDGAMVVTAWFTADDNTMAIQSGGGANPGSVAQWRNLSGADCAMSASELIDAVAGASGAQVNRQTANGGDTWNDHVLALKPLAGAAAVPTRGLTLLGVR